MPVDIFGRPSGGSGLMGPPGPPGPRGRPGIPGSINDLCAWMPRSVLNQLQKTEEECCLVIEEPSKDIKRDGGNVTEWISRTGKCNAKAEKASKDLIRLPDGKYALDFHENRYVADGSNLFLGTCGDGYSYVCITFRVQADTEQAIISNFDPDNPDEPFQEISATSTEIRIWGGSSDSIPIYVTVQHDTRDWTTLFVDWTVHTDYRLHCNYIINNDPATIGSYEFTDLGIHTTGFSIGGRYNDTKFMTGTISALDVYCNWQCTQSIPSSLRHLIVSNQMLPSSSSSME